MNIPNKIVPERLKDTIVEIRFKSETPFEYRLGLCHQVLKSLDVFPVSPFNAHSIELDPTNFLTLDYPKNLFEDGTIRLRITDDRLIFNTNGIYCGWQIFGQSIQNIVKKLFSEGLLGEFYWVGLRYVSEFEKIHVFEKLIWDFQYDWQGAKSVNTSFRTEWLDESDHVIVNLVNNAQRENDFYSLMDIDINYAIRLQSSTPIETLFEHIERLHDKEKTVFFGLMKPDFLESLNPIY
jgi:uncharacterized protein (TIGR04255 family)